MTYILTRNHWHDHEVVSMFYISKEFIVAMQRFPADILVTIFSNRLKQSMSTENITTIFYLIGEILGNKGATLVRNFLEKYAFTSAFGALAYACSKCLPLEEGYDKVTHVLAKMNIEERCKKKEVLRHFDTQRTLDWIEKNAHPPIDITWGPLAGLSKFNWNRTKKWLLSGRPLSLIALDALAFCASEYKKTPLINLPSLSEFITTLDDYLDKDNVPRVTRAISNLKYFSKNSKYGLTESY